MTTLGWSLIAAAAITGAYGFAWALCQAARIGDDALVHLDDDASFQQFDVEPRYVDAEFARIADELDVQP